MAYSEEVLRRARARLDASRQEKQETYEAHLQEAYARYPRLLEIDKELRGTVAQVVVSKGSSVDTGAPLVVIG